MGKHWKVTDFILGGSKITADGDCSHEIKRHLLLGRKVMTNLDIKKQRHKFANKCLSSQSYGFSNSHIWMWELDYKESWVLKNWWFWTVVLKTLESPLDCKEVQPVHPQGDQSWIFIIKTDAEAETPIFGPPDVKNWLWKIPWCWEKLKVGGEGDDGGWDGWMASPTWCIWVWVNSGRWCWIRRPGMLRFVESQRVGHDWATELNWGWS